MFLCNKVIEQTPAGLMPRTKLLGYNNCMKKPSDSGCCCAGCNGIIVGSHDMLG